MDRIQSSGPDEAPHVGEQHDVETAGEAAPEEASSGAADSAYSEVETDPLGGTGGVSSGGAG